MTIVELTMQQNLPYSINLLSQLTIIKKFARRYLEKPTHYLEANMERKQASPFILFLNNPFINKFIFISVLVLHITQLYFYYKVF